MTKISSLKYACLVELSGISVFVSNYIFRVKCQESDIYYSGGLPRSINILRNYV